MELNNKERVEENSISCFRPGEIRERTKKERQSHSFRYRYPGIVKGIGSTDKKKDENKAEKRFRMISGAIAVLLVLFLCFSFSIFDYSLGYEAIVDGKVIGIVADKAEVYAAISETRDDVKRFLGEDTEYEKEPVLVRRLISNKKITSRDAMKNALLGNVDAMVECYALSVDGQVLFGVASEEAANWVLNQYKQKYSGVEITDDTVVDFCEKTEVKKEHLHISMLETPEDALTALSGDTKQAATYVVQENDTLWGIAQKYDTTVENLLVMNDGISENIRAGYEIKVEKTVPLLSVRSVQTVSLIEDVPYEVEKINDNTIYKNTTVVSQRGKEGEAKVLARVTKINGVETQKDILESEVIVEPVKQIEKVGTKPRPATTGSGTFSRPSFGSLSSRYGARWGRNHNGIDIAGSYNSDIKAADGGVVTYAGWMSGYGNYVVINHENGYQTAYGHCASLLVSVGSRVAKGDVIAKMGNTGRSTGTHLHFEVRKNGVYMNPLNYVSY